MTETTLTLYGKQHKTRTIEVSPRLAESIEARRERLKKKPGDLLFVNQIWTGINSARVLVAELTGRNPNVLYELGLAHALRKPVVLVSSNKDDVPFDAQSREGRPRLAAEYVERETLSRRRFCRGGIG